MGGSGGLQGTATNWVLYVEPAGAAASAVVTFPPTNTSVRGG